MKKYLYFTVFLLLIFSGCGNFRNSVEADGNPSVLSMSNISYMDIPGISEDEIRAIEELQNRIDFFVYGMNPSTEAFEEYGEIRGFTALFCEWLTELFGIPFIPSLYDWSELISGLESEKIDFTGELTASAERRESYFMTDPIARRSIKYLRMVDSVPIHNILASRTPRYAFLRGSVTIDYVDRFTQYSFDKVFVDSYSDAYDVLVSGQADAFFADNSMEMIFDIYDNVIASDFIPVIGLPVSLSTQNPQLRPVISVVQKALANGASEYLAELYNLGRQEHSKHRLYLRLSEEEREFLLGSPVIPYAAEFYNYPISFYNMRERQWQGIFFDILDELIELTGLHFEIVNDENTIWTDLLGMLIDGEAYLITELLQSEARVGNFLWPSTPTITDNYALLSKSETPNVSLNEVFNVRVGVPRATAYADMLHSWFPLHTNIVEYESFDATFEALNRGDVDMVLTSQNQLLTLTNYYELSGYKANLIFEYAAESFIGFHIDQAVLCSIIDKALHLIDVRGISYQWASRTFDFQARLLQAQRPWLIGAIALASMVLLLMTVLFARSRSTGKRLDSLVKKRTAELEIAIEAANAANKSKSSFLANMSHEIRTPMNTILGVTDILMQNESLPDEVAEGLNRIYGSSDMLMGIINDILDLSKIEAGKLDIIPSQYYVASLINDSIHLNLMRIGDKPIEFDIQIDENLPAKLMGDELRIKQIFNNLLSNAFKYTESGKVTMSVLCEPCDNGVMLVVSVQDTGRGMTPEQVAKLFDEYSRFDEASSRSIEGTGLGLSITQRLINLMDGKIHVESTPGVGTLFSVSLPQGMVDSEILGMELAASLQQFRLNDMMQKNRGQVKREMMPYGKVLVVDDVEANLFVAEGLLKPYKLRIETVISGYAAIEKIKEGKIYDIVFMDHMMPGMDGIETVKHIRDLGYSSSIVALTANAVAGQADIFLQSGFNDFISKPIDTRQLNSVLNKMIRDKQPQEVLEAARSTVASSQADSVPAAADTQLANIKINGLDIIMGLDKFEDDTELYLRILRSYTSSVTAILPLMENVNEETLIDDKLAEYQRATHSVKGTSLDICAEQIGNKAGELEDAAKEKNLNFIVNENPEFLDNLKKLIRDIEDMLSGFDGKTIKPKKDKIESELLLKLQGFCENYDMDGVDTVMAEIEEYEYESDHDLSAWLRKNVDVIDFDVIAERLSAENGINK